MKKTLLGLLLICACSSAFASTVISDVRIGKVTCGDITDESRHHGHDYFKYGTATFRIDGEKATYAILGGRLTEEKLNNRVDQSCKKLRKLILRKAKAITVDENMGSQSLLSVEVGGETLILDPYAGFEG